MIRAIFNKLFPCKFDKCHDRLFGCRCGNFGKSKSKAEQGITEAGGRVAGAGAVTPAEAEQYAGSFDIGKLLEQLMQYQAGVGQAPQGYRGSEQQLQQGPVGQELYKQTQAELQDPYAQYDPGAYAYDPRAMYQSELPAQMKQVEDIIGRSAAGRGFAPSGFGLGIEQMGRAGVDLAIKEANKRLELEEQYSQQMRGIGQERAGMQQGAQSRAGGLLEYGQTQQNQSMANLANLYSQQQGYGQQAMGRNLQGQQAAAPYYAAPYEARLGDIYGQRAALYSLPGQALGAAAQMAGAYTGAKTQNAGGQALTSTTKPKEYAWGGGF